MTSVLVVLRPGLARDAIQRALRHEDDLEVEVQDPATFAARAAGLVSRRVVIAGRATVLTDSYRPPGGPGFRWIVQVGADDAVPDVARSAPCGLYSEDSSAEVLVEAVRHVAAGRGWIAPELVLPLLRDYVPYCRQRASAREEINRLTDNQVRLLSLVATGRTNAEIATELGYAVATVKDYVGTVLERLGVTRARAIVMGVRAEVDGQARRDDV